MELNIPDYAKDIKLNITSLLQGGSAEGLSEEQIIGTALATAYATREEKVIAALEELAKEKLSAKHIDAAKTAASLMAMNNVYYRFIHLVSDKSYGQLPAKLRMHGIRSHGIEQTDFELYSMAVSALNGCGMCMDSHAKQLEKEGIGKEGIQTAVRIAAVLQAWSQVNRIESTATVTS